MAFSSDKTAAETADPYWTIAEESVTASRLSEVANILERVGLPVQGLAEDCDVLVTCRSGSELFGCVILRIRDREALLRSLAVVEEARNRGIADRLHQAAIRSAARRDVRRITLMTTSAERFFERRGYERVTRSAISPLLLEAVEFSLNVCRTAVVMQWTLPANAGEDV